MLAWFDGMARDEAVRLTPTSVIANFILVVEDDEEEAAFLKDFLEKRKFRVTIAKDGGQAQATFVMRKPDFVILDLILPGESGFEVCVRMKQANSTYSRTVILTAIDLPEARSLAERVGADDYLTKPSTRTNCSRQFRPWRFGRGKSRTPSKGKMRNGSVLPVAAVSASRSAPCIAGR